MHEASDKRLGSVRPPTPVLQIALTLKEMEAMDVMEVMEVVEGTEPEKLTAHFQHRKHNTQNMKRQQQSQALKSRCDSPTPKLNLNCVHIQSHPSQPTFVRA